MSAIIRLQESIDAACPGANVQLRAGVYSLDFAGTETEQQRTAAQAALAAFDWSQAAHDAWEVAKAKLAERAEYDRRVLTAIVKIVVDKLNAIHSGSVRQSERISLGGYNVLTNVGATYDAIAAARGLGLVRLNFAGVSSLEWGVAVQKIGTGTQSWQLWNETDGVEMAVINDAGAATTKFLNGPPVTNGSLPAGEKLVRIRAKSTVAADDPVYFGGWLVLGSLLPQFDYAQARDAILARVDAI